MTKRFISAFITLVLLLCSFSATVFASEGNKKTETCPPAWVTGGTPEPETTPTPIPTQTPVPVKKDVKVPILLYHHISNDVTEDNAISVLSPDDFRKHMTAISINYDPISLRQYVDYIDCTDGSVTLPDNPIIITFDDGYESNYSVAFPILQELKIPATIFVVTDTVGEVEGGGKVNNTHFTWDEARIMEQSGLIDIQSHTHTHSHLSELDTDSMIREIRKSKFLIEKNLNKTCDMLAFPYGSYNDITRAAAKEAGYKVQVLVDDKTTKEEYEINNSADGYDGLVRMTITGKMGNVNVIELIRKVMAKTN